MNKEKIELKKLDSKQLEEKIVNYRHELFSLKLASSTSHVKDNSGFKKLRKNMARALTYLRQKRELGAKD